RDHPRDRVLAMHDRLLSIVPGWATRARLQTGSVYFMHVESGDKSGRWHIEKRPAATTMPRFAEFGDSQRCLKKPTVNAASGRRNSRPFPAPRSRSPGTALRAKCTSTTRTPSRLGD